MSSGFIEPLRGTFPSGPLLVEEIEGSSRWKLARPVVYRTDTEFRIIAPEGMITDFASIPRLFWGIFPPWHPTYGRASVIHDYLYQKRGVVPGKNYSRREANLVFLSAMKDLGAPYFLRQTLFNAVQMFGFPRW